MCCSGKQRHSRTVEKHFNSDGQINWDEENENEIDLPEHVDNLLLNRNVHNGVLGFRYENKDELIIVYSSIEAKTFSMIMQITPLKK